MKDRVTSQYEHALQSVYYDIGNRGICVDIPQIEQSKLIVDAEIKRNLAIASAQWNCPVFVGEANAPKDLTKEDIEEMEEEGEDWIDSIPIDDVGNAVNLNATQGKYALLTKLKDLGYDVPKIPKKNEDGEYETHYSAGELAIQKMLSANQFGYPGGDPALRAILRVREYGKLKSSYLNARFFKRGAEAFFLSNYNVAGTLSGRRGSRRHKFGFGNNAQNFPKHSEVAHLFRKALTARPGHILLMVDQIQAEDWPVSALSNNTTALEELRTGVDRHSKLASAIFNKHIPPKNDPTWNDALHDKDRYLGKKCRHASNYDMTAPRMSDALAQEGFSATISTCKQLLDRVAAIDPSVKGVFHKYVRDTISATRILQNPFGRERQFLSCRPDDTNSSVFKEAFSWIPQGTVGDNTGFAVLALETQYSAEDRWIVQEGHDSIIQDVVDTVDSVYGKLLRVVKAFDRVIKFHNGIEVQIPIEAEIGYDFQTTVKVKDFTRAGVAAAMQKLQEKVKKSNVVQIAVGA